LVVKGGGKVMLINKPDYSLSDEGRLREILKRHGFQDKYINSFRVEISAGREIRMQITYTGPRGLIEELINEELIRKGDENGTGP
jgi:hypothetical protein